MRWKARAAVAAGMLGLALVGCSTNVYVKGYEIEKSEGSYRRLRIAVPTASAGAGAEMRFQASGRGASASTSVVDAENILAIVQNEVTRSLQGAGHKVMLVTDRPDLDLRISFEAPAPYCDLLCLVSLGGFPLYRSVGGAQLVDARTGNILTTYELNTEIRAMRRDPPSQIQDWETFAKKLADNIRIDLEKLQLAEAAGPSVASVGR